MFLRELFESISVSQYTPELQKGILNIVRQNNNSADIIQYLTSKLHDITGTKVKVKVKNMPKGDGAYIHDENTLYINTPVLKNVLDKVNEYKSSSTGKDTKKYSMVDSINRLISVFLHETTHVIQISKSGVPYEKSYVYNKPAVDKVLTKLNLKSKKQRAAYTGDKEDLNKTKLNVYLARLGDPTSEINIAVDRAQPEEIAAYANQSATEIISQLQEYDKHYQRAKIRTILKQIRSSQNNDLSKSIHDYKIVKKYSTKAHNKFFKLLYLQLIDYYDNIR